MASKLFLIINGLIIAYLVLRLFMGGRRQKPTPLKFDFKAYRWPYEANADGFRFGRAKQAEEKTLNCHFQFEGITWDAFEVLGVPAGSDRESCWVAFNDLKRRKSTSPEFLSAAWQALERHFSGK